MRHAAEKNFLEIFKLALKYGAEVDLDKDYALRHSGYNNNVEIFNILANSPYNRPVTMDNDDILKRASERGHHEIVQICLDKGANPHVNRDTCLRRACKYGHLKVVDIYLGVGTSISVLSDDCIRNAAANGHSDVVRRAILSGADASVYNNYPLRYAAKNGHLETVKVLMDTHGSNAGIHANADECLRTAVKQNMTDIGGKLF